MTVDDPDSRVPVRVAVYGTLRAGGPAHHLLGGAPLVATGVVHGGLFRVSWYPVLDLAADGCTEVEVYDLDAGLLGELDRYEGVESADQTSEYRRALVEVLDAVGSDGVRQPGAIEAWAWVANCPTDGLERVPGDRWPL